MCGPSLRTGSLLPYIPDEVCEDDDVSYLPHELAGSCTQAHQGGQAAAQHHVDTLSQCSMEGTDKLQLRIKGRQGPDCLTPPLSPRSACSTPGRTEDTLRPGLRRSQPRRQFSSKDKQRFSQDSQRPSFCGNPWVAAGSQGASSAYSSSSSCSIVRAIASLGLDGQQASGAAGAAARAAAGCRGSISKAKRILAEAISSVPGAHGLASCASSAADTGVLSPLLTIIRNNGVVKGCGSECGSRSSKGVSRRSSFSEALSGWSRSSLYSLDSSTRGRVLRRSSFSEAAGGLNSLDFGSDSSAGNTAGLSRIGSPLPMSPCALLSPAQQQQKVVDCLETVRYLAMDDSNRMALIDLGAVELLLSKMQPAHSSSSSSSSKGASSTSPAIMEAALSALSVLAKHDATKLRVWDNPQSAALLQLLSQRHTSPVVKAAHLCVANLAWSVDLDRSYHASSGSSVFDSVSSHPGRDDATSTASSSCGSNVLLTTALIPAVAAGLHPAAEVPVLLSLLKLLDKAAGSSCLAPSAASSPCSSSRASDASGEQLCAVQVMHSAALRVGWQQVIFALPPLLTRASQSYSSGRGQLVLGAALGLLVTLTEQHPEFHAVVCAAGCLAPLLALLLSSSNTSRDHSLQAACALNTLLDCPVTQQQLSQERSLQLLLQVLGDSQQSVDVRLAMLHMLRRLAAASQSCVGMLKAWGAVQTIVVLLQQVQNSEVKRAAVGLLQLLGKQVVVRPRKHGSTADASSQRSSFESACSSSSAQSMQHAETEAAVQQLKCLALHQQQAHGHGHHRLAHERAQPAHQSATPYYLHAH